LVGSEIARLTLHAGPRGSLAPKISPLGFFNYGDIWGSNVVKGFGVLIAVAVTVGVIIAFLQQTV
jgi:hypothetical protein